ncbi:PRC-barrel domain protein [Blastococcus colisei]|uniref:PRC-barrel domain protein n=1 Tax=Blastococcus colisei TaxID=1564162 RepID=A0A543NZZ5_9ACTN|nr:PRC-barrel domain-containing protein [Blastococcus colisei]TQN37419.1 PRC-barrel domain protein [Blastococcus colisei]
MTTDDFAGRLVRLSETDQTVADPAADVRGRPMVDRSGEDVGRIEDLLIDEQEKKVRLLRVGSGGFLGIGKDHFLVPVDAIESIDEERVVVGRDRAGLADAPAYDPELADDPVYYATLYGWWGYGPYWTAGYVYPPFPYYR